VTEAKNRQVHEEMLLTKRMNAGIMWYLRSLGVKLDILTTFASEPWVSSLKLPTHLLLFIFPLLFVLLWPLSL
jgi:hypothetical protein